MLLIRMLICYSLKTRTLQHEKNQNKMAKKKKTNWLIWGLVAALIILIAVAIMKGQRKPKGEEVEFETVEKRTIKETVAASGKVFPEAEVKISSDVSGEIVELLVEEGDSVQTNQVLAKIDPDAFQSAVERGMASVNNAKANLANSRAGVERNRAQLKQAEAQREQTAAQLANFRTIFERNKKLYDEGVISEVEFDQAKVNMDANEANLRSADAAYASAQANLKSSQESVKASEYTVKSAEASLRELQTSLRRTTIYAPTDGIVSMLSVEQGERVVGTIQMTGTEMMRIANMNAMEVQVDVSENDVLRVNVGDEVDIEVDAYLDRKFKGKVTEIANSANTAASASLTSDQVTNFVVKISVDPSSYKDLVSPQKPYPFRPGMSASVEIYTNEVNDVVSVPIQAVTTREEENDDDKKDDKADEVREVVFVHSADTVKMVDVTIGIQDDSYIEIKSGLTEGDEIVIGPYSAVSRKLEDGSAVTEKEEKEEKDKK